MITTEMILSLGEWEHKATAKNGGSKLFYRKDYQIYSSADNFIFDGDDKRWEIRIAKIPGVLREPFKVLYEGIPKDLKELKVILVETGADTRWLDEIREDKLQQILNEK